MQAAQPALELATPTAPFVLSHTFEAPRGLVWKAFTEEERLKHWWGPKGFPVARSRMDLRPGGMYHYAMHVPDGSLMWGRFIYREIVAPERIVFVNGFSDESGAAIRHPMIPAWPMEVLSEFRFSGHGDRTTFSLHWTPINASAEECAMFESAQPMMTEGWTGTLEQLDAYLATA
jgi:uncharacterized protein YndB with AHSA1/START domain